MLEGVGVHRHEQVGAVLASFLDTLAQAQHYETQERLMTRIVPACAEYPQIEALTISLRKRPVLSGTGTLGVRLIVDGEAMTVLRNSLSVSV